MDYEVLGTEISTGSLLYIHVIFPCKYPVDISTPMDISVPGTS